MKKKTNNESELESVEDSVEVQRWSTKKIVTISLIAGISAIALAILVAFLIAPIIETKKAQAELNGNFSSQGEVAIVNNKVETFKGQNVTGADINQKMLIGTKSGKTIGQDAGVFVFSNGKENNQKVVEVFADFSSQTSRDFLLLNMPDLKKMVEGGIIDLHIKPVPTGDAFTMYSAEAIAKTISNQPDRAWDFIVELLKLSAVISTDKPDDLVSEIVKTAEKSRIDGITDTVIKSGSFASWIIATGDDSRLKVGYYPPVIYIDGKLLDQSRVNINDKDSMREYLLKR